jgi:anti-sigma regulatory factor (Ser/Thr protein kinase)
MSTAPDGAPMRLRLPASPIAAHTVRAELAADALSDELRPTVALLATEAVANSVRHAGLSADESIEVRAWLDDDRVRVEVDDQGSGFDPEIRHKARGYGLRLIDAMASQWGAVPRDGGWTVWFEVDRDHVRRVEPGAAQPIAA